MSDFAQTVKQQADIVKVIGGYIRLRKAGAQNYSGLCPFHKEKSPSFSVHGTRQFYHCFGCGQSPKREYNSPEEAAEAQMRRKLLDLHEAATAWFEEQLRSPEGALAREYLAGRGVTPEAIKTFRVGYAPDNFNALRERLSSMADADALRASGLFSWKEQDDGSAGRMYDRFRKRVMFPIANESGRVIAFTARALETGDKAGPKYINSPETPLYSKGQVLFNLDKAKGPIRSMEFALLVEGQMDCISVFMRGIQSVIATSGTAFTEQQVALLRRHTTNVVVNFDPDAAGANAAEKSIGLLTEEGFQIKVVTLDGGLDPDRFIRERGVEAYIAAIRGARRQSDYLIERARQQFPGAGADSKIKAMNYLLPHIRRIPEKLERDQFMHDAAQKLGIDSAIMREEFRQASISRKERIEVRSSRLSEVERVFLRALAITDPGFAASRAIAVEALRAQPAWFEHLSTFSAMQALADRQANDPMDAVADPQQRALLAEALLQETEPPSRAYVVETLASLEAQFIEKQLKKIRGEMAEAERQGGFAEALKLAQYRTVLERRLSELKGSGPRGGER